MSFSSRTLKILAAALNQNQVDNEIEVNCGAPFTEEEFTNMPLFLYNLNQEISESAEADNITTHQGNETSVLIDENILSAICEEPVAQYATEDNVTHAIIHTASTSEFTNDSSTVSSAIKLVDYDTSSSEDEQNNDKHGQDKSKILLFQKRLNSDLSYFSEVPSTNDSDFEIPDDHSNDQELVGESGLKKKKQLSKKVVKKTEHNLGKGRAVKEINCKKGCRNGCAQIFTESERHDIHEFYWGLGSYERQRNWLLKCCEKVPIRRRKQLSTVTKRHNSFKYYITWNDERVEICQQFLLKTLDISQMVLRYAVSKSVQNSAKPDQRGRHEPHNKTKPELKEEVHNFIKKLPAVPSHYCRTQTVRKYLPIEFRNVGFLYRILLRHQEAQNSKNIPSLKVFRNIFLNDFNLGFHLPKKDKCKMCESRKDNLFEETEETKNMFKRHLEMKEESKELFLEDQKKYLTDNNNYICASFDLQKVLNTPHGDNLLLYYSRKYSYYNETIYESGTRNGYCYIWGESDGNRGCNEICTIIYKYLVDVDKRGIENISLYCDSCSGQNKNRAMLVMLDKFLQQIAKNIQTIKIVYLLPGHTYMPVDSVHATIERSIKNKIIWAPSEWDTILTNARINPKPLEVKRMNFADFRNWKRYGEECLPLATKTVNNEVFRISIVRQAYFEKGHQIQINYSYDRCSWISVALPAKSRGRRTCFDVLSQPLYCQKLPISCQKKQNLDNLCKTNVIPTKYHNEYFSLKSKASVRDVLPETDEEDELSIEGE